MPASVDSLAHAESPLTDAHADGGTTGTNKSVFRGVSYDKKKRKWRVQIKVASLGKSGVSVGYYDTELAAARAYDRAALGLLGRESSTIVTNFPLGHYVPEEVPCLVGKTREQVKVALKTERAKLQAPRRRFASKQHTSKYLGVGSSNRRSQWQARILINGKVTHLGYHKAEEQAARVYDRVSIALHGPGAQTNFPAEQYADEDLSSFRGLSRVELQRALGVCPLDKGGPAGSKPRGSRKRNSLTNDVEEDSQSGSQPGATAGTLTAATLSSSPSNNRSGGALRGVAPAVQQGQQHHLLTEQLQQDPVDDGGTSLLCSGDNARHMAAMSSSCWVPAPPPAKRMHLARNDQTIAGLDGADCSVDLLRMGNHVTGLACYTDNELAVDSALPVDFLYGNSSGGNGSSAFDHLVAPVPAWLLSAVVDNGVSDKGSGSNGSTRTQGSSASVTLGAMPGTSATFDVRAVHQRQQLGGCPWQQHGWSCAPDGASPLGSLLVGDASIDLGLDFLLRGDAAPGGLGWQAGIDAASSYLAELGPFNINTTSLSCLSGHELEESSDSLVMDEFLSMVGAG